MSAVILLLIVGLSIAASVVAAAMRTGSARGIKDFFRAALRKFD